MAFISGEKEKIADEMNEKIYVAVSKEWKACKSMLEWVLDNLRGRSLCLVHVHEPAQFTTLFGLKFPVSSLSEEEAIAHQEKIKQDMLQFLDECVRICSQARVQVEKLYVELESVENGLLELITQHKIERFVMGAAADKSFSKKMKKPKSKKANYVRQHAPAFCHIWFICKGHLISTREGMKQSWLNEEDQNWQPNTKSRLTQFTSELSTSPGKVDFEGSSDRSSTFSLSQLSPFYHPSEATTDSTFDTTGTKDRESSFQPFTLLPKSEGEQYHVANATRSSQLSRYHVANASRSSQLSSDFSTFSSGVGSEESSQLSTDFSTFSSKLGSEHSDKSSQFSLFSQSSKAATDSTFSHSGTEDGQPSVWSRTRTPKTEGMQHHLVSPNVLQEGNINNALYSQLEQAILEATNAKKVALEELMMRRKAEKDAIDAFNKAEAAKNLYYEELRRRKELEEELAKANGTRRSQKHRAQHHGPRTTPDHYESQFVAEASS